MSDFQDPSIPFLVISSQAVEDYDRETRERLRRDGPLFAARLRELGVTSVVVRYDGCRDSGQIEDLICESESGDPVELTDQTEVTPGQLTKLFYDLIQVRHPGWEVDDGAFGELTWDLTTNAIDHAHTDRFMSYQSTEHEGGL